MKLRTFHLLCYLCLVCTFVQSRNNRKSQFTLSNSVSEESTELFNANNLRDKRALGLILSGLAQVFGYTVDPVQIASLPNPNSEARVTNNTIESNGSTTSAARQRETIRFTGVVNLGNGTDVLTQLQQYENIFHGGNGSSSSTSSPPQFDPRTQTPVQPQPFLIKRLPLPFMSEPPLPTIPQPPLPEIPSQFINLSYPESYVVPTRNDQDTAYKSKNATVKDQSPIVGRLPTTPAPSTQDPGWKQEYEDRLAKLERKQEEHAKRLMEQERYRNGQKNDNNDDGGSKKEINHRGQDSGCKGDREESDEEKQSGEEDQSRESYESGEKIITSDKESEDVRYRDYKNDDIYKGNRPQTNENYTSIIQYSSEPLPLSEDDEQRRPEDLRNSYGEPLFNGQLFVDGFANFFGKLKQPLSDIYSSLAPPESKEEMSEEEVDLRDEEKSDERSRDKDDVPARNKYEEYTLEGDTSNRGDNEMKSKESNVESPMKIFNNGSNDESRSPFENRETTDEVDFSKFMPLIVPVRYLTAPEESRRTQLKSSASEKPEKNNMPRAEVSKKVSSKESKRPKKENLKPVAGLLERRTPKKLHESEQKEMQLWPPPFDFVFDGTIHTNVVSENSNNDDNINVSNGRGNSRESESSDRMEDKSREKERNQATLDNSTQKPYDYPENIYYQNFKEESGYGTVPEGQTMENRTTEKSNRTSFEIESDHDDNNRKEVPDFSERYKYISYNNYGIAKRPNIGIENFPKLQDSKNLESSKRSIERNEQPLESKQQLNVKNRIMQDIPVSQRKFQSTMFFYPMENYNLFNFDGDVYDLNYGRRNERLSGISEGDKNVEHEERDSLTMPQQNVYHYDESLTKIANEPESKAAKVENYANGATVMRMVEQEHVNPNGPISYVDYSRIL
ncbi:uncharacterized protein LOC122527867 [Frieseomelitta varia]|uniref:uncharacterized protein LOC122527867 n=1 Tax=Frieseomelitta varia TaxID=561572 RepID=UPI001CB6B566|nr:uncharacterized protein LOC122527867 [Frieseomelitta varia]